MADKQNIERKLAIGRRGFMRSVFGLGTLKATEVAATARETTAFYWCNIKNGQVGFPTGFNVPCERPGSIMKLVATAAILEEGLFNPNEELECTGTYRVGHEEVHCQKPHGKLDIVRALGFSCNVFFAKATHRLTAHAFFEQARALGLTESCAGRPAGPFPTESAQKGPALHYVLGLADDFKPSALALLRLAALVGVGPGGTLPVLHSAEDLELSEKEKPFKNNLSKHTSDILHKGMHLCAREGTARKLDEADKLKLAVKTGTTPHGNKFQSLIVGYFPIDDPRHAFCLVSQAGTSQDSAVPRAREFLTATTWP